MKAIVVTDQAAGTAGMTLVERPEDLLDILEHPNRDRYAGQRIFVVKRVCRTPSVTPQSVDFGGNPQPYTIAVVGSGIRGRSTVNTHPSPGMSRAEIRPLLASTPHRLNARPMPKPVRSAPRCSKGRNSSSTFPFGRPPHSS